MFRCKAVRGRQSTTGEGDSKRSAQGKAMAAFRKQYGDAEGVKIEWQGEGGAAPGGGRKLERPAAETEPRAKPTRPNPAPAKPEKPRHRPEVLVQLPEPPGDYLRRRANKYQVVGYTNGRRPHHVEIVEGLTAARVAAGRMEAPVTHYVISKLHEAGALQ